MTRAAGLLFILISSFVLINVALTLPASLFHEEALHKETKGNKQLNIKPSVNVPTTAAPETAITVQPAKVNKPESKSLKIHQGLTKRNNGFSHHEQVYSEPPGAAFRPHFRRDEFDRRRRSPATKFQFNGLSYPTLNERSKRDLPSKLDNDEALALLALWASGASPYRLRYGDAAEFRYDVPEMPSDDDILEEEFQHPAERDQISDAGWVGGEDEYGVGDRLNVMRRAGPALIPILPNYSRRNVDLGWGDYEPPSPYKRFMVTKRSKPPISQDGDDVYSFAQLLSDKNYQPAAYRRFYY